MAPRLLHYLRYLDPYYYFDLLWDKYVGKKGVLKLVADLLYTILLALLTYKLLGLLLGTPRPAVIVASSSMVPTLYPGDVVIVKGVNPSSISAPEVELNLPYNYHVLPSSAGIKFLRRGIRLYAIEVNGRIFPVSESGDIVVYYDDILGRDIIHRVILKIRSGKRYFFITKGDNWETNPTADQDCIEGMCVYPFLVGEDQVLGKPIFVIPRIGIVKLFLIPHD